MKITHLKTNRIRNPLGFAITKPSLSWIVEDTPDQVQKAAQVIIAEDLDFQDVILDSGKVGGNKIDSLCYQPDFGLNPRTRYYWKVRVWGESEQAESDVAWFETAKMNKPWQAQWITPAFDDPDTHPTLFKRFDLPELPVSARLYICGLGLYQLELNGQKVSDEVLAPGCNAYDQWLQYQTYDLSKHLHAGTNLIAVMLGNGWYKGRYGLERLENAHTYGDRFALICELHITLETGQEMLFTTDNSWKAVPSPVLESSIYDGEVYDSRIPKPNNGNENSHKVELINLDIEKLEARRSLPVCVNEEIKPIAVLQTPAGETVLDMGQNMVGWVRFKCRAPKGTEINLKFGEVLQEGNFYRENLRTAKAEYTFIANGEEITAEPHFTFYGFRYVKITGWVGELSPEDFTGCVVYSSMEQIGEISTSDAKVNQLFKNALWGQKGNFLDIPTDCPQRDERLGWTGDTQVFSGTACFNMDSGAFFSKFLYDLGKEQEKLGGTVPFYVPTAGSEDGGSSAWGDAATIIPWNVYQFYGDASILEQQLNSMRSWVDFIRQEDDETGGRRLWTSGFHFGDWLALDGPDPLSPFGGTPVDFISSAYYYFSTRLVARAANVLGKLELAKEYFALAAEIKAAINQEYFTATGRLAINTQTGYVLALFMDLALLEFQPRIIEDLVKQLRKDNIRLKTGFVGTPYICQVLSEHGANDLAYQLLLNEDYPSWLFAVNLGATTIWERWNSLNPDGSISSTGMNSLNHYAYGAIVEWMYRYMCGLNPSIGDDQITGFRHAKIAPKPDPSLEFARARYRSASGWFASGWEIGKNGHLHFEISIPFNAKATLILPNAPLGEVLINGAYLGSERQVDEGVELDLFAGQYVIDYQPTRPYFEVFSSNTPLAQLIQNRKVLNTISEIVPSLANIDEYTMKVIGYASIREMAETPFLQITEEQMDHLDHFLKQISR